PPASRPVAGLTAVTVVAVTVVVEEPWGPLESLQPTATTASSRQATIAMALLRRFMPSPPHHGSRSREAERNGHRYGLRRLHRDRRLQRRLREADTSFW